MKLGVFVLVAMLGSPAAARMADDPVTVKVMPAACVEPCSVRLTVRVAPDDNNRTVTITADSAQSYRSSTRDLEPEGPRYHQMLLENLPSGEYEVRVVVDRAADDDRQSVTHFHVHGDREALQDARRRR